MSINTAFQIVGWMETISNGIPTFYLAITDEGMVTGPSDTPANTQYRPRVLNPEQFSIDNEPVVWPQGDTSVQRAGYGTLLLDNYDGMFNFMLREDIRDYNVVMKFVPAGALLTGTTMNDAPTVATFIVENASTSSEDVISVEIKDVIARLDRPLPVRFNPPFAADGAANVMILLTFGSVRNRPVQLVDQENRIFLMHDAPIPNVTKVTDKAAPLDPNASPPQYTPAVNGSGIQLHTLPDGKLCVDCSSYGSQAVIPGAVDVLNGDGLFAGAWAGTPAVPPNWSWTNHTGAAITEALGTVYSFVPAGSNVAILQTQSVWFPSSGSYGDVLQWTGGTLEGGVTYRLSFGLFGSQSANSTIATGGLLIATALTNKAEDYIAGYTDFSKASQSFLTGPRFGNSSGMSFEFTVPAGAARNLYFILSASVDPSTFGAVGSATACIHTVRLEKLGKYTSLPQSGIPYDNYLTEILVNRAKESSSIFNSAEAAALFLRDDGTLIPWGISFDSPPNILDAVRIPLDSQLACAFPDHTGQLRFRKWKDPSNPVGRTVLADFDKSNMVRPISVEPDNAENLTTVIGARFNPSPYSSSDFVTDQAIVPQDVKTRFMRQCQFERTSSILPAGHYSAAVGAPIFNSLLDEADDAQDLIDLTVGGYSPKVYTDGTSHTGKRIFLTFTATFDDILAVGSTVKCAATDLIYGTIVKINYPTPVGGTWFTNTYGLVVGWKLYPFAKKITLKVQV